MVLEFLECLVLPFRDKRRAFRESRFLVELFDFHSNFKFPFLILHEHKNRPFLSN